MKPNRSPLPLTLPLIMLLAACGGGKNVVKGNDLGGAPVSMVGFPPQTIEGIVYAEAHFNNHPGVLGTDLVEHSGVLPIWLKVVLRGEGQAEAQTFLSPDRMNLRLFLPDGTALGAVPAAQVAAGAPSRSHAAIGANAFQGGLLGTEFTEGYVFFALVPPSDYQLDGWAVRHKQRELVRTMDLGMSLLTFDISVDTGRDITQSFYVGIQK